MVHYRVNRRLELHLQAVAYLTNMLWSARKALGLLRDEAVPAEVRESSILRSLSDASATFGPIRSPLSGAAQRTRVFTEADSFIEFARIVFLTQVRSYNRVARFLAGNKAAFRVLYRNFGELELALAVLSLRMSLPRHTRPSFTDESVVRVQGLYHPLLEEPVLNDAAITRNSLVSGSNASGKSTFIKAVAINGILAQTINTCTATRFQLRPALVVTSMAARDNILAGESYFIAEIRSLKRLVTQARRRYCLCFVDEILKGTNTTERIAASTALLRQFSSLDGLCLVATHDIELTVLLKELFDNYHFEEQVTSEGVSFDYLMRSGPSRTRNAIKLLATMGFDEAMVRAANALVETHERTGQW
jgi:DNA mismatch repair ATPase MutS